MTSEDFCNWLKGYLELANPAEIRAREIEVIREHLELTKRQQIDPFNSGVIYDYNKSNPGNPNYDPSYHDSFKYC